jgi:hypothetical protein
VGLVPSVSSKGSATFIDCGNTIKVFRALLRYYNKATKTVVGLYMSNCGSSSPNIRVSLALSSSHNHLISVLVAVKSA